jgi:hypothetical protein
MSAAPFVPLPCLPPAGPPGPPAAAPGVWPWSRCGKIAPTYPTAAPSRLSAAALGRRPSAERCPRPGSLASCAVRSAPGSARVLPHSAAWRPVARQWRQARGRPRPPAPQVRARGRAVHWGAGGGAPLRAARTPRAVVAPTGGAAPCPAAGAERQRSGRRVDDDPVPTNQNERPANAQGIGMDGQAFWTALDAPPTPQGRRHVPAGEPWRRGWRPVTPRNRRRHGAGRKARSPSPATTLPRLACHLGRRPRAQGQTGPSPRLHQALAR